MELHEALEQISEIRLRMAKTEVFRGYRSAPVAVTGILAIVAAEFQAGVLPDPRQNPAGYLALWIGVAFVNVVICGSAMAWRFRVSSDRLTRETTWLAVEQFLPSLVAGSLLTAVLGAFSVESLWMLPGLWAILFSLGIFASYRLLPHATFWVAVYYLVSGILCLALARESASFSPWAMAIPFGIGQLAAAGVLYWKLERSHEPN